MQRRGMQPLGRRIAVTIVFGVTKPPRVLTTRGLVSEASRGQSKYELREQIVI